MLRIGSSVLDVGMLLRLGFACHARRAVELGTHALLHTLLQCCLVAFRIPLPPQFDTNGVRSLGARELVHQADPCDHVGWLDGPTDHAHHDVVPILVDLPRTDIRLQLNLKMAALRVHGVLPFRLDALLENHDRVNRHPRISHDLFLVEQIAGLRQAVPNPPELVQLAEGHDLLQSVRKRCVLAVVLNHLLPKHPLVFQHDGLSQSFKHCLILLFQQEICISSSVIVEAQKRNHWHGACKRWPCVSAGTEESAEMKNWPYAGCQAT
mmetsp:Transcript_13794/g.37776  ORF Transcript_13794/g.37776 Transcript_13794/m.37776 type:complete len:266 (-) Transcript_13794:69-866(-)